MKKSKAILFNALMIAVVSITLISGCKKEGNTTAATCTDGIKNQNETAIDCGGSCTACPTCSDGIKNGTETGIDCGGSCTAACSCPYGYEGTNCTTTIRAKFIGYYSGSHTCTLGNASYVLRMAASGTDIGQVVIANLNNLSVNCVATVSGSSFTVPLQTIGTGITVIGSGTLSGNTITFNYTITTSGSGNACVFTGTK